MKTYLFSLSFVFFSLFTGCSGNYGVNSDYDSLNQEDILSGGADAPILYGEMGDETTGAYIYWTEKEGGYYEVEEADCSCFSGLIYNYYVYNDTYFTAIKNGYYYRVRSISASGISGWSNIVVAPFGGRL